jgi:hypothetical protein
MEAGQAAAPGPIPLADPLLAVIEIKDDVFLGDIRVRREPTPGSEGWRQDGLYSV